MNNHDRYEEFLMELIVREVHRAADSDPELASPKARRRHGEVIIREMPTDLTAGALRGADPAGSDNLRHHKRVQQRLLSRWRRKRGAGGGGGRSRGR